MKKLPPITELFLPELPGPDNSHEVVRDGDGDGHGGAKFKKTHFRPDSSNTFPYEPPTEPEQSEDELEGMLKNESFGGGFGGPPRRSGEPGMSLYRLSYGGGESNSYGNHEFTDSDFQINPNGDPENRREEDRTLPIDLVAGHPDKEKEEEEFLDHMKESIRDLLELRNVRARACSDGMPITTKNGWSNGNPSKTGIIPETDDEVKSDLGIEDDPDNAAIEPFANEALSIRSYISEYSADSSWSQAQYTHHGHGSKEDEEFFDNDEDLEGQQDHGTIRQ